MDNINIKHIKYMICALGIITILISLCRCFLGVDVDDEALYIGEPFFVAHGATPYVNDWLQASGFSFFLAPVVALYELLVPTRQGIFLFMRIFFLVVKVLIYISVCFFFRKTRYKYVCMLAALPLIPSFFSMIPAFNYTSIPLIGLFFASILLLYQWYMQKTKNVDYLPCISGIILACITLCSPTQILNCLVIMLLYYFCINKKACWRYVLGGLFTALFFTIYMIMQAGSLSGFISSLKMFLNHPYFSFGLFSLSFQAYYTLSLAIKVSIPYIICILGSELLRRFFLKKFSFVWACKNGLVIGAFLGIVFNLGMYNEYALLNRVIILLSIGCFFFRFLPASKEIHRIFDFVVIPEMVTFTAMVFTVYGGAMNRFFVFTPMALICLIYVYDTLKEQIKKNSIYIVGLFTFLFLIVIFKYEFQTIYGEFDEGGYAPVTTLTTQVEKGVYSGLFTSENKAIALQKLETYIHSNTSADEYVLFMDRAPMAYLMTEAHFCSPTSWDPELYSEGFRETPVMLQNYFAFVKRTPDKVIYIDPLDANRAISIENEDYEFTQYVKHNYILEQEEVIENKYKVMIYSKNTSN